MGFAHIQPIRSIKKACWIWQQMLLLKNAFITICKSMSSRIWEVWENLIDVKDLPGRHVVFRKERNLQNFCAGDDNFLACCSDGFSCDAVNLIESVGPQIAVICRTDEHLQIYRLLIVANQLLGETNHNQHLYLFFQDEHHFKNSKPQLKKFTFLLYIL